ncbi:MAG: hypothetical protein ACRDDZ_05450 [Marinifilaceae bacterium]
MIDINVQIHDKFSIEFKVGYMVDLRLQENDFITNIWMFIPSSLDINSYTYGKEQFYKDVTSHIRLITPIYDLGVLDSDQAMPWLYLTRAITALMENATDATLADYEYQIKMYGAIVKSALRKRMDELLYDHRNRDKRVERTIKQISSIASRYRTALSLMDVNSLMPNVLDYYRFADEFISNTIEQQSYRFLEEVRGGDLEEIEKCKQLVKELIAGEVRYKKQQGFMTASLEDVKRNRTLIYRRRELKKYIESQLYLGYSKKKDGQITEQVYYSIAAGLSMIFATTVAFSFQSKYGNFTMPLFIALVVSYMLKDRIKELMRYYFVKKMSKRYFDNKTTIHVKHAILGWMKESADFVSERNIPQYIIQKRGRSSLLEADNRITKEKILLYRKQLRINGTLLDSTSNYVTSGINNILRFNLWNFIQKMDNPEIPVPVLDADKNITYVMGEKVYYVNFLLQFKCDGIENFRRYRITMSRDGIKEIELL